MNIFRRCSLSLAIAQRRSLQQLTYASYGNPTEMLSLAELPLPSADNNSTEVKILMAPINPADINTIQGVYPIKPPLPAVPGGECVAEVIKSNTFKTGDRVIVLKLGWGTWKDAGVIEDKYLYKVPDALPDEAAATLSVNPCTAYRMLKDFVALKKNDVVIQNGANSAVGQFVIQLCREWGFKSVNIVRNRPEIDGLKSYLKELGADVVLTEEELAKGFSKLSLSLPKPRLALNTVGGRSSTELIRSLAKGGSLVTYGGMSKQPVITPTASFIFTDVHCLGFWMSRWKEQHEGSPEAKTMLDELTQLMVAQRLKQPKFKLYPLSAWREAIERQMSGFTNEKLMFSMLK